MSLVESVASSTRIRFLRGRLAPDSGRPGLPRRRHLAGAVLSGGLLLGVLSGCGSNAAPPAASLLPPPLPAGSPPGQFAIKVLHGPNGAALLVAGVRIDGQGPYPFLVDTGSGFTDVSPQLSRQLHLPAVSPLSGGLSGAACGKSQPPSPSAGTTSRVKISHWDIGGVQLPTADVVTAAALSQAGSGIDGRIGSDVLSRLSPLTIDYRTSRATLAQPAPATSGGHVVPVKVLRVQGEVLVAALAGIDGYGYAFFVDTGADRTLLTPSVAKDLKLHVVQKGVRLEGVTCSATTDAVRLDNWHLGSVALPTEDPVVATVFSGEPTHGLGGLIGGDVLSSFGTITLDYTHQTLALGS